MEVIRVSHKEIEQTITDTTDENLQSTLVLKACVEQLTFKDCRTIPLLKAWYHTINDNNTRATYEGNGQRIIFDSPEEDAIPVDIRELSFDCVKLCFEKKAADESACFKYLILKKVDESANRYTRIGTASLNSSNIKKKGEETTTVIELV